MLQLITAMFIVLGGLTHSGCGENPGDPSPQVGQNQPGGGQPETGTNPPPTTIPPLSSDLGSATLSWDPVNEWITGYKCYVTETPGVYPPNPSCDVTGVNGLPPQTTATITSLRKVPQAFYVTAYRNGPDPVTGVMNISESGYSDPAFGTPR